MDTIDIACDICGQKHTLSSDRYGTPARCRACDNEFEVHDCNLWRDPEDDDAPQKSVTWIKGAGISLLVAFALAVLGALPFHEPAAASRSAADPFAGMNRGFAQPPGRMPAFGSGPRHGQDWPQGATGFSAEHEEFVRRAREASDKARAEHEAMVEEMQRRAGFPPASGFAAEAPGAP